MAWESTIAYVGIIGILLFPATAVALHLLPTGYNPIRNPVSDYAAGQFRILIIIAFLVLGVGTIALDVGLGAGLGAGKRVALGVFFIGVFGATRLLAAFFPSDVDGSERTALGRVHSVLAAFGFIAIPFAAIVLTPVFGRVPDWHGVAPALQDLELLIVIFALIVLITRIRALRFVFGLAERFLYASALAWLFVLGLHFAHLTH